MWTRINDCLLAHICDASGCNAEVFVVALYTQCTILYNYQFVFIETISDKCQSHSTPSIGGRY